MAKDESDPRRLFDALLAFELIAWWAAPTWITLAAFLGLAVWRFRTALAGQPVFRERLFES